MLVAGEPSGDVLGAALMQALRRRVEGITFIGVGGPKMAIEGLSSVVPIQDLAVMGLVEVLPRIATLLRHIRRTAEFARREQPDVLVTIDAPGFNFRLARRLTDTKIPRVHYVAPSVWAWRPGRAKKIAPFFDHLLALLPFEPPYFDAVGLATTFVGHPALERDWHADPSEFRTRHDIAADDPILLVLPGSRRSETDRLLPIFGATVQELCSENSRLRIVIPTVDGVEDVVRRSTADWPGNPIVVTGDEEKASAFSAATAALAASGTISLELALGGVPTVVAYDVNPITAFITKRLVKTRYVSLVNIIAGREIIPEYLLRDCRSALLVPAVSRLLRDPGARDEQRTAASGATDALRPSQGTPSDAAAAAVLAVVRQ
ncbi:MAG: lipid-A-disaccharide synthase [Alphaproteobacteria bacterium]|nr:lipid-A-disaccharide synthase [Alphaproteobacteria bacterium]